MFRRLFARVQARARLSEEIAHVTAAYPPSSVTSPTSRAGHAKRDPSVYVGSGGNAYLHWKLSAFFEAEGDADKSKEHLGKAAEAVEVALSLLPPSPTSSDIAFYIGSAGAWWEGVLFVLVSFPVPILQSDFRTGMGTNEIISIYGRAACVYIIMIYILWFMECCYVTFLGPRSVHAGVYTLAAAIFAKRGDASRAQASGRKVLELLPLALSGSAADEVLYGRAGYLSCLLFLRRHAGEVVEVRQEVLRRVFDAIVASGRKAAAGDARWVTDI